MSQVRNQQQLIHVRFEQGRGETGVPKTWIPYLCGHPADPQAKPDVQTLVRMAVGNLRAQCADPHTGHGRDVMPGEDADYQLHNVDGALIESIEQIRWETFQVGQNQEQRAELVLTWLSPATLLAGKKGCL